MRLEVVMVVVVAEE